MKQHGQERDAPERLPSARRVHQLHHTPEGLPQQPGATVRRNTRLSLPPVEARIGTTGAPQPPLRTISEACMLGRITVF
jgi:hypothetical protein